MNSHWLAHSINSESGKAFSSFYKSLDEMGNSLRFSLESTCWPRSYHLSWERLRF